MDHVLQVVFNLKPDSILERALEHELYVSPEAFISEPDETLTDLKYPDDTGAIKPLPSGASGLLKSFKRFVAHLVLQGATIDDNFWTNITKREYDTFRISTANNVSPIVAAPVPSTNVRPPPVIDLVKEFKRGIKRDTAQFSALKDDAAWDNWSWGTKAQAWAQDLSDVLNPSFTPTTIEDADLFQEKQKFMYAVFEKTLLTDKRKALVCQH